MRLYSHSGLSSFESCPRQFWYRYIGKPDIEKVETVEAFLGQRVHETLEELYRLRLGGRVLSESETLEWYEAAWAKAWTDSVRVVSPRYAADDYRRVGREAPDGKRGAGRGSRAHGRAPRRPPAPGAPDGTGGARRRPNVPGPRYRHPTPTSPIASAPAVRSNADSFPDRTPPPAPRPPRMGDG